VTDEAFTSQPVEVPAEPKRKRRKYRKYPRLVCTPEQKAALWEHQKGL
jgi:hypothetical protein